MFTAVKKSERLFWVCFWCKMNLCIFGRKHQIRGRCRDKSMWFKWKQINAMWRNGQMCSEFFFFFYSSMHRFLWLWPHCVQEINLWSHICIRSYMMIVDDALSQSAVSAVQLMLSVKDKMIQNLWSNIGLQQDYPQMLALRLKMVSMTSVYVVKCISATLTIYGKGQDLNGVSCMVYWFTPI